MNRFSKTISNLSIYLLMITLLHFLIIATLLILIKRFINSKIEKFSGSLFRWIQNSLHASLTSIQNVGIILTVFSLFFIVIILIGIILINSRKSATQRLGYFFGIGSGLLLLCVSFLPLIFIKTASISDELMIFVLVMLFIFFGFSSSLLLIGSIFGIISAKTEANNYEPKVKINKNIS
ncbi:hypothetical protein S100390_v1c08210 [Spiroplasma sp. NBRC 100390]|uniref:hypothetical protein n=1 Tax=unclassified Spiroplasma TaxID=2637901 RepID=UPI000892A2E4|nr:MULTISPECIES: hypothetical protein [unclassified Spiroplasma]AOX44157.1 hypothetical protein STU14_v1c08210 [Spiroplasma sp. TU-14]APE13627.1 hypothetical protein S100390_v1c08210 [Spiroplasma sp. NBRC 100390]